MAARAKAEPAGAAPRPRLRERQRLHTRESLMLAAKKLFEEKDLASVTVDDIVAEAGMSRATFYVHYKSKEDVLTDVMRLMAEEHDAIFVPLGRGGPPTDAEITAWLERIVDRLKERPLTVRLSRIAASHTAEAAEIRSQHRDRRIAAVGAHLPAFRVRDEAHRVACHLLLYQIEQLTFHLAATPAGFDHEVAVRTLVARVREHLETYS